MQLVTAPAHHNRLPACATVTLSERFLSWHFIWMIARRVEPWHILSYRLVQERSSLWVVLVASQTPTFVVGDASAGILACLLSVHLLMMPCAINTMALMGHGMPGILPATLV